MDANSTTSASAIEASSQKQLYITELMRTKAGVVELVATRISINNYGLPEGYYRPDLLPNSVVDLQKNTVIDNDGSEIILPDSGSNVNVFDIDEDRLDVAYVKLSYDEGFPTTPEGSAYWSILEFELPTAHAIFKEYLELSSKSIRMLTSLTDRYPIEDLQVYFHMYYWNTRAKAYDLFKAVSRRKEQNLAIFEMHDDHVKHADQLSQIALDYIKSDEFEELLTPKVALETLKMAVQLRRLAQGLPANAPPNQIGHNTPGANSNSAITTEGIIHEIVGDKFTQGHNNDQNVSTSERAAALRDKLLRDPEAAKLAQDLILAITHDDTQDKDLTKGVFDQRAGAK